MSIEKWSARLTEAGASAGELDAITASYQDAQAGVQAALDGLIAGIDRAGVLAMLTSWRAGDGPFGDGFPGGGLPFGTHAAILTGNPADDAQAIGAGTGVKLAVSGAVTKAAIVATGLAAADIGADAAGLAASEQTRAQAAEAAVRAAAVLRDGTGMPAAVLKLSAGSLVAPSGDSTGTTDVAQINAALSANSGAAPLTVWLTGKYYVKTAIQMPSNTTLILCDAEIVLTATTIPWNIITNASLSAGNNNIKVIRLGRAVLTGNASGPNVWNNQASWQGIALLFSKVVGFEIGGLKFQNINDWNVSLQNCAQGYVHDFDFVGTPNGMQNMGANADIVVERMRGYTLQPGVVFEAVSTAGTSADAVYCYDGLGTGEMRDITISDIQVAPDQGPLVWICNGRGSLAHRVRIADVRRPYNAGTLSHASAPTNPGRIQLGANPYQGAIPLFTEMFDIDVVDVDAQVLINQACSNVKITGGLQRQYGAQANPDSEPGAFFNFLVSITGGSGVNVKGLTIDGVTVSAPFAGGSALMLSDASSTADEVVIRNIHVQEQTIGNLLNNAGTVTNLRMSGIYCHRLAGAISASAVQETGSIDNVNVGAFATAVKNSSASQLRWGWNMPLLTSADTTPANIDGSIVRCDSTKVLDGGAAAEAVYWNNGSGWSRLSATGIPTSLVTTAGDLVVATGAATVERLALGSAGQVLTVGGADPSGVEWAAGTPGPTGPAGVSELWGDGSDGALTFDGSSTIAGFVPASNVYTLNRPLWATTIVVNSGVTIKTGGWPIYATTSITNSGTIDNSGANGSASGTAGTGASGLYGAANGGSGATGVGNASASVTAGFNCGSSGSGGAGSNGAGGSGTAPASPTVPTWPYRTPANLACGQVALGSATKILGGTPGGGGGGGDATNKGGGGGASGGLVALLAPTVVNSGTISANGGNGGTPVSGNCGGGGAGAGGAIVAVTTSAWTAGTTSVARGSAGSGVGTGANGNNGATAGNVLNVVI